MMRTSIACISHGGECNMHAHSAHVHVTGAASLYLKARSIEVRIPGVVTFSSILFMKLELLNAVLKTFVNLGKGREQTVQKEC